MKHKLSGEENFKKGKIRKTRQDSNGSPVSKRGKIRVQNWKSDPMNSPKAFGELIKPEPAFFKNLTNNPFTSILSATKCLDFLKRFS